MESEGRKRGRTGVVKTPAEIAARRIAAVERSRKYREQKKATETPEQAAERCAKRAEHLRKTRAVRTAKQRAKRAKQLMKTLALVTLEKYALKAEQIEQNTRTETAEQENTLLLQESECNLLQANVTHDQTSEMTDQLALARPEGVSVEDRHLKSKIHLRKAKDLGNPGQVAESRVQQTFTQNPEQSLEIQYDIYNSLRQDDLQDDSRDFESSINHEQQERKRRKAHVNKASMKDTLHCIQILLDARTKRDEHSIYGEYIAQKIRTCKRECAEINIAQHHIENIIFKLCMGVYSRGCTSVDAANNIEKQNTFANSSASGCFQPLIIPKTEPDP